MSTRTELDRQLDHLAAMLPVWLPRVRHGAQFWPQFTLLSREILAASTQHDVRHVLRRLDQMLVAQGMDPAARTSRHAVRRR